MIASDHWESFGEHGLSGHGHALVTPRLHVPLVVLAPGRVPPGTRVAQSVSPLDLPATILDPAQVDGSPDIWRLAGRSLRRLLGPGGAAPRGQVMGEVNRGIRDNPLNPTTHADPETVLDDTLHVLVTSRSAWQAHGADTAEVVDLAADSAGSDRFLGWVVSRWQASAAIWKLRGSELPPPTSQPGAQ